MPDISDAELLSQLDALEPEAAGAASSPASGLPTPTTNAPLVTLSATPPAPAPIPHTSATLDALASSQSTLTGITHNTPASTGSVTPSRNPIDRPETLSALGAEPGVPFDPTTGASWLTRLASQFTFNRAQAEYAFKLDPAVKEVRYNSLGDPVLRIADPDTGEARDILANPLGMDIGDSAFVLANAPLLAGGLLAGAGKTALQLQNASGVMRALMGKGVLATSARMAVGGRAAQAGAEALGQRVILPSTGPARPENTLDTLERQGTGALGDFLFGTAIGAVGKALTHVVTPTGSRGPIQVNAANAEQLVKASAEKAGLPYYQEITPGEATGSEFLQRTEVYEAGKPGSSGVFKQYTKNKLANDATLKQILLGTDPEAVPAADIVGQNVNAAVKAQLRPIDELLDRTTQETLDAVNAEIKKGVASTTGIPSNLETAAVGKQLFDTAELRHTNFREADTALYDAVKNNPLVSGQGRNIDATPLAKDAQELLKNSAAFEKDVPVESGLLDQFGNPTTRSETRVQPITAVLNPNTTSILKQLADAEGGRIGLSDLMEARTDIGDAISRGSVLGGIGENRLNSIYGALSDRIKTGLNELDPSGDLLKKWETANTHHAENIAKFRATSILPMFKDAETAGALTVYDVVNRAVSNQGKWMAYRDFFGPTSPEMNSLRRVYADRIVGRVVGSDTVDYSSFARRLQSAYEHNPDIVADVFAGKESQLKALAEAGNVLEKGGAQLDATALAESLQKGTLTRKKLEQLALEQHQKSEVFKNKLLSDIAGGKFDATPSQIVDHLVFNSSVEPDALRKVVSYLSDSPQALEELQQRVLLKMFNESSAGPRTGEEYMQSNLLRRFLKNGETDLVRDRLSAVLGGDTMNLLDAVHDLRAPGEAKSVLFASAGALARSQQIATIERNLASKKMLPEISHILKSWLMATLYNTGPARAYIGNTVFDEASRNAFVQGLVLMTPAIQSLRRTLGSEAARLGAIELKSAIDRGVRQEQAQRDAQQGTSTPAPATRSPDITREQLEEELNKLP